MNEKNNGRTRVYEKVAKGEEKKDLYAQYVLMPFTTLYMQSPHARERKKYWEEQGISDLGGRNVDPLRGFRVDESTKDTLIASSFNPVLAEVVYKWFAPEDAVVLDPFAGGMTRGAIAARMGLHYVGFDVRKEQIDTSKGQFRPSTVISKNSSVHFPKVNMNRQSSNKNVLRAKRKELLDECF